jgi:hypothetical protein
MRVDPRTSRGREGAARVGAQALDGPAAVLAVAHRGHVGLDPGLTQALACTEGELLHGTRRHPEQRRGLTGAQPLDLAVPEHLLPAARQGAERAEDPPVVVGGQQGVLGGRRIRHRLELVDRGRVVSGPRPRHGGVPDGREQVGAERSRGAAAAAQDAEHAREGLLHEVVRVGRRARRPSHRERRTMMPVPEGGERVGVARA